MDKEHKIGLTPKKTKDLLDNVSETFCLAKWKQVTLNLHTGTNASCCLTPPSSLDFNQIKQNPIYFHNTHDNLKDREGLKEGKKVKSCSFCWEQEKQSGVLQSERIYKSSSPWAIKDFDQIVQSEANNLINPSYLEVSFSNKCNLKCIYCNPQTSSSIYQEIKKFGPYGDNESTGDLDEIGKRFDFNQDESKNPYVSEFLNWFPELVKNLDVIRFTGGEPLYSDGMFKCLDHLIENKMTSTQVEINTNLSTSKTQVDKLVTSFKKMRGPKRLITSLDTFGADAEYIRAGLNLDTFKENLNLLLENISDLEVRFTVTFNIFSPFQFIDLLKYTLELKRRYKAYDKILLSIYPLISPYFLSIKNLNKSFSQYFEEILNFLLEHQISESEPFGFNEYEIDSFRKVYAFFNDSYPKSVKSSQLENLFYYITDFDQRKDKNAKEIFPEIADLLSTSRDIAKENILKAIETDKIDKTSLFRLIKAIEASYFDDLDLKIKAESSLTSKLPDFSEQNHWELIHQLKKISSEDLKNQILLECFEYFSLKESINYLTEFYHFKDYLLINHEKKLIEKVKNALTTNGLCFEFFKFIELLTENQRHEFFGKITSCLLEVVLTEHKKSYFTWEIFSFFEYLSLETRSSFLLKIKEDIIKSIDKINHAKNFKWEIFKFLEILSNDEKEDYYSRLKKSIMDIEDFKRVTNYITVFNDYIDKEFVDFYFNKMKDYEREKKIERWNCCFFLFHMDKYLEYLNQRVLEESLSDLDSTLSAIYRPFDQESYDAFVEKNGEVFSYKNLLKNFRKGYEVSFEVQSTLLESNLKENFKAAVAETVHLMLNDEHKQMHKVKFLLKLLKS